MALDLETMKADILTALKDMELTVFFGFTGLSDTSVQVYWDVEQYPDFRDFLAVAKASEVKLVVFHHEAFSLDQIDDALEQLRDSDLSRDDKRSFEKRLRELQPYEGFTCSLDLSFTLDGRLYCYRRQTEWYLSLDDILIELDAVTAIEEEDEGGGPMGGYFSKN